ncbi:spherulation-specific family 4 protein [Streptomyces sp. NPDC051569]|uniref:spherulation-specific family 4 protein n=1 Tax=Streptomyces sp. NPDC051569 TaxID=3365661 RepID=UPI003787FDA1
MPHLTGGGGTRPTASGDRLPVTGAGRVRFGVPGYAHPLLAPVEWAELARPGTPLHWAVLNVAEGPGARPDPHCVEAVRRLGGARVRVLGHLDLAYGTRPFGEIVSDAVRFLDWYRVGGFFLDRCPADRADLPEVRRVTAALRAELAAGRDSGLAAGQDGGTVAGRDGGHLVLGHGTHPYPGYAENADQLVTFSGPWTDYRWSQAAEWTADYPPERFVHLVHGIPRTHLDEALRIARWQGAGTVFFTDRTGWNAPFETLPGYWDEIVSRVGPGVSE